MPVELDRCRCDAELAQLAKDCIERDAAKRPADAGIVTTRISDYLNAIQSRLKEAEIAAARAAVKAEEDRKRRRRNFWSIAAVALLLLVAGIFGPIIAFQQAELRREADRQRDIAAAAGEREAQAKTLAVQRAEENRRGLYFSEMMLASQAVAEPGGVRRVRHLTAKWASAESEEDLRGWEWHYLDALSRPALLSFDAHRAILQADTRNSFIAHNLLTIGLPDHINTHSRELAHE